MTTNRRDAIKAGLSILATRAVALPVGLAASSNLVSCGGGGGSGGGGNATPAPSTAIAITSASTMSPVALTPIALSVAGLDFTMSFTVTLATQSGSVTFPVVRSSAATSTVVIAWPLYLDPSSGATAALSASVSISQGAVASNAISFAGGDLPSVASYGANPGDLSRGLLNVGSLLSALNINSMQALASLATNTISTTTVQQNSRQLLVGALQTRSDIDAIVSATVPSLAVGTLANGDALVFDSTSVDAMDRVCGLYLQALGAVAGNAYAVATETAPVVRPQLTRGQREVRTSVPVGVIGTIGNVIGIRNGFTAAVNSTDGVDKFIAVGQGMVAAASIVGLLTGLSVVTSAAVVVGTAYGIFAIGNDIANWYIQSSVADMAIDGATEQMNAQTSAKLALGSLGSDFVGSVLGLFGLPADEPGLAAGAVALLKSTEAGVAGVTIAAQGAINNLLGYALVNEGAALQTDAQTMQASNAEVGDDTASFAVGSGSLSGLTLAGQGTQLNGVQLTDPSTSATFTTLADTSGDYDVIVPLGEPYDYGAMDLGTYDVITGSISPPTSVDLNGLSVTAPLELAPIPALAGGSTTCTSTQALPGTLTFTLTSDNSQCTGTAPIADCGAGGTANVTVTMTEPSCSNGVVGTGSVTVDGVTLSLVVSAQVISPTLIEIGLLDSANAADPTNPSYPEFLAIYNYGTGTAATPNFWQLSLAAPSASALNDDGGSIALS